MRGFDIRTVSPRDPITSAPTGGNKSLLFNGEFYFHVGGPVRILGFYDAGQVRDQGQSFVWNEEITRTIPPPGPLLSDPFATVKLDEIGNIQLPTVEVLYRTPAFKTSTGVELRFFMPVLNVPFRLIWAYNPSRRGVLNNNLQPTDKYVFRFAVGTTF